MAEVTHILCPICHKRNLRRARFCQHCGHDIVLNNDGPRYYITRVIKEGGQGAVYETIDDAGRVYAVKEMLDRFVDPKERAEALARFETEAGLLERLRHPRIPRVYADFKDEGRSYLAMDYVRGNDLEELLTREGRLPEPQVLEWADQICDVLGYLHANGLIYRDMKPSNIMIDDERGGIKLIDFGIAKVFQPSERGTQIGTPGYAPPEQYQGLATAESDIYALGATLHHMLTGRDPRDEAPFSFPAVRSLAPAVSARTSEAIGRALQMRPEDRFRSVSEFRAALRPLPAQPPQVRRAPATVALPARPAASAPVAPAPAATAVPAPATPVQQSQPARRRGGIGAWLARVIRALLATVVVLALAGATLYFAFPGVAGQILAVLPSGAPSQPTLLTQRFSDNFEVTVPAGADDQALRQAFVNEYTAAAQQKYGSETRVNIGSITYVGGAPVKLRDEPNGDATFQAEVDGIVLFPQ